MKAQTLLERRDRTHAIVEGALLGEIAVVFLLFRAFLPLPGVRQLLKAAATVPFVMLIQRRGVRLTILAAIASYVLFSALVGPLLALSVPDIAVAGILAGMGRRARLSSTVNILWTGPVYAVLDLFLPTVASVILFRYPVNKLIKSAQNFVKLVFNVVLSILRALNAPVGVRHMVEEWKSELVVHWQFGYIGSLVLLGLLTMYLTVIVAHAVLRQIPEQTLSRRRAHS